VTIAERYRAINSDFGQKQRLGLRTRLEVKAKGKCQCGKPFSKEKIVIGHGTPQQFFAESCIPLTDAIRWCNDDKNLFLMHEKCNALLGTRNLKGFFKKTPTRLGPHITPLHVKLAQRIRDLRDFSQEELASRAGLHSNTIRRLETLRYDPKLSTINAIAKVLKIKVSKLVQ
jgi:DNA-binding XRE family transcriptional regulator